MSRKEIMNDPELCKFLENPYLKDNMEVALRFQEAKTGGYEEKKDFLEYLYANGPELDADTLMYYREKCYQDQVYLEIAEIEFTDLGIIDAVRVEKYNKPVGTEDDADCFNKPCDYLGPLSANIGLMGDSNNFRTMPNIFSMLLGLKTKQDEEDKEADKKKEELKKDPSKAKGNSDAAKATKKTDKQKEDEKNGVGNIWGNIRQTLSAHIIPYFMEGYQTFYGSIFNHLEQFAEECKDAGIAETAHTGDPNAIPRAEGIDAATKLNVMNSLGDCARLWERMRRYNPYDGNQNQKGPMSDDKVKNNKNFTGSANNNRPQPTVTSQLPEHKLRQEAAKGNKKAEMELYLQKLEIPFTQKDIDYYTDPNIGPNERKEKLMKKLEELSINKFDQKSEKEFFDKYGKTKESEKVWQDAQKSQEHNKFQAEMIINQLDKKIKELTDISPAAGAKDTEKDKIPEMEFPGTHEEGEVRFREADGFNIMEEYSHGVWSEVTRTRIETASDVEEKKAADNTTNVDMSTIA